MQAQDGRMIGINQEQFNDLLTHGSGNVVTVGDVFCIRRSYFRVETISPHGISAKGISHADYVTGKAAMPIRDRLKELPDTEFEPGKE